MRSCLGLRRISDIEVTQLLRASQSDLRQLRHHLTSWRIPSFTSYPLLLRALTHPSMSNWAERILKLPKRSLGPNTLELLGDRVVGVCVAADVHIWTRAATLAQPPAATDLHRLQNWSTRHGATSIVASLVGNKGLAVAARAAGMYDLLRWEKPLPPAAHRARLDEHGVDVATGLGVNREVNALAAAYEAVAAAVYLDGGFVAAREFIRATLLESIPDVQKANMGLAEYQQMLVGEVARWTGVRHVNVESVGLERAADDAQGFAAAKAQCGVFDLEPVYQPQNEHASPVYYAAVMLRSGDRANESFRQRDVLSVASHFSVATARIAAAIQAAELLQGRRPATTRTSEKLHCSKVQLVPTSEHLQGGHPMDFDFMINSGKWVGDGDYARLANVLDKFDVPGMAEFSKWDGSRAGELRQKIGDIYIKRTEGERMQRFEEDVKAKKTERRPRPNKVGSGLICERSIAECLELGQPVHSANPLHGTHRHFLEPAASASDICAAVFSTVNRLNEIEKWWQVAELRGYNCLGANTTRLWSVQQSMQNSAQDRSEVIGPCEARMANAAEVEQLLVDGDGLEYAHYLPRIRKGFVGLGIVVQELGTNTALQWLSGAEVLADMRRQVRIRSGSSAPAVVQRNSGAL